jgi:ribosomal protein S18 acetylase RimI-like enzyme
LLTLRRYHSSDQAAVWALHLLALAQTGALIHGEAWDADLRQIEAVYLTAGEFVVGLIDERIVAMGALKPSSETRAEIKRMRVHPDHQRQGYGQQVLTYLEQRARELQYRTLHLETTNRQPAAQGLYRKQGYREVARKPWRGMELIGYEKDL